LKLLNHQVRQVPYGISSRALFKNGNVGTSGRILKVLSLMKQDKGVKLLHSPDLKSEFTEVSNAGLQGEDELIIKLTAAGIQDSHGFFRIHH
jgi:hypothetical protein